MSYFCGNPKLRLLMKKFFAASFRILYVLLILVYVSVCFISYLPPGEYWITAFAGLVYPVLVAVVVICCVIWLFINWRWGLVGVAALFMSWQQLSVMAAYRTPTAFKQERSANTLRILSWNVSSWGESNKYPAPPGDNGGLTVELIKKQDADVLCFQEFRNRKDEYSQVLNIEGFKKMGYPYAYFIKSFVGGEPKETGVVIFSKYPFLDTAKFSYGKRHLAEHLIYADIAYNDKTVRIFTTHLQSVRFDERQYEAIGKLENRDGEGLIDSKEITSKLRMAYYFRESQAELVREKINESPYPSIVCGDFNDVPNSFTYFTISDNLQDAFLKKGSGFGRTFRYLSPTLRIDYILASKQFQVNQYNCLHVPYSDHYPIVSDIKVAK